MLTGLMTQFQFLQQAAKAAAEQDAAGVVVKPTMDQFTVWLIKRVRQLNPNVEAELFASLVEGIESPNDVEDYLMDNLGIELKAIKEFHREFLTKRIELRPRVHSRVAGKDVSLRL